MEMQESFIEKWFHGPFLSWVKGDQKISKYLELLIKESSFIQIFNYKLPLRKKFSPLNRNFTGSSKYKIFTCNLWFGKKQFVCWLDMSTSKSILKSEDCL